MGFKHTAPALQAPDLTTTERAVLALCAEFANAEHNDCMWHDQEAIADRLEVRRETVGRALAKAERLGYVTRTRRYRTTPDGARQRDRDTIQVHHSVINAATEAKLARLRQKWDAKYEAGTPETEGAPVDNPVDEKESPSGVRDERSHSYVTTDHMPCDERSQHNREPNKEPNKESVRPASISSPPLEEITSLQATSSTISPAVVDNFADGDKPMSVPALHNAAGSSDVCLEDHDHEEPGDTYEDHGPTAAGALDLLQAQDADSAPEPPAWFAELDPRGDEPVDEWDQNHPDRSDDPASEQDIDGSKLHEAHKETSQPSTPRRHSSTASEPQATPPEPRTSLTTSQGTGGCRHDRPRRAASGADAPHGENEGRP